ncbi:MAG: hypothetical protein ACTS5P_00070 [Candidatus Hodgkinia cicadicola]
MCFPSKQLIHFEEVVSQTGKSFLIIADEIGGKALTTLVLNELRFNFKVSSVKLFNLETQEPNVSRYCVNHRVQVISLEAGTSLENATLSMLLRPPSCASKRCYTLIEGFDLRISLRTD